MSYGEVKPGEWLRPPKGKAFKMECCDCGLVHYLHFRVRKGRAEFKAYRNNKATAMIRRSRRLKVMPGELA